MPVLQLIVGMNISSAENSYYTKKIKTKKQKNRDQTADIRLKRRGFHLLRDRGKKA
jgi:hypothetical protein